MTNKEIYPFQKPTSPREQNVAKPQAKEISGDAGESQMDRARDGHFFYGGRGLEGARLKVE